MVQAGAHGQNHSNNDLSKRKSGRLKYHMVVRVGSTSWIGNSGKQYMLGFGKLPAGGTRRVTARHDAPRLFTVEPDALARPDLTYRPPYACGTVGCVLAYLEKGADISARRCGQQGVLRARCRDGDRLCH